jgi:methionyl-tRNA formyltransferase
MNLHPGTTVHYIDKGEDTGDIICQEQYPLVLGTRLDEMLDYGIGVVGVCLLLQAIHDINCGRVVRKPQNTKGIIKRAANVDPEQYVKLIDWRKWPIERIWHFLRGTERMIDLIAPSGGLFSSNRWVVMEFVKCNMPACYGFSKVYKENGRFFLACSQGKIYLSKSFSFKRMLANLTQ